MNKTEEVRPTPASVSGTDSNTKPSCDITTTNDLDIHISKTNSDEHAAHASADATDVVDDAPESVAADDEAVDLKAQSASEDDGPDADGYYRVNRYIRARQPKIMSKSLFQISVSQFVIDDIVAKTTNMQVNLPPLPEDLKDEDEMERWNDEYAAYQRQIMPPAFACEQLVPELRRYCENWADGRFPGVRESMAVIEAVLKRETRVYDPKQKKNPWVKVPSGMIPLYQRDYDKRVNPGHFPMPYIVAQLLEWKGQSFGSRYIYGVDGERCEGMLMQRDSSSKGPYRIIEGPLGPKEASPEIMQMVQPFLPGCTHETAIAVYQQLVQLVPRVPVKREDPRLVALGSGWMIDPITKRGRRMTDDDVINGCLAGLTFGCNEDGTIERVPYPYICEDGTVVYDDPTLAEEHGGVAFDPLSWLEKIMPDPLGRGTWWGIIQASATPGVDRGKAVFLIGKPRAGKGSTLLVVREAYGGDNARRGVIAGVSLDQMGKPEYVTMTRGASVLLSDESNPSGYVSDSGYLKAWITNDIIVSRDLYKSAIMWRNHAFGIWCLNSEVGFNDKTEAMFTRTLMLAFNESWAGREDRRMRDWVQHPAVVNWIYYHAIVEMDFIGELKENAYTLAAKQRYQFATDPLRQFVEEELPKLGKRTPLEQVYDMYKCWAQHNNPTGKPVGKAKFCDSLEEIVEKGDKFYVPRDSAGKRAAYDIRKNCNPDESAQYLEDATLYCTRRESGEWTPAKLHAWCRRSTLPDSRKRGWLFRVDDGPDGGDNGFDDTPETTPDDTSTCTFEEAKPLLDAVEASGASIVADVGGELDPIEPYCAPATADEWVAAGRVSALLKSEGLFPIGDYTPVGTGRNVPNNHAGRELMLHVPGIGPCVLTPDYPDRARSELLSRMQRVTTDDILRISEDDTSNETPAQTPDRLSAPADGEERAPASTGEPAPANEPPAGSEAAASPDTQPAAPLKKPSARAQARKPARGPRPTESGGFTWAPWPPSPPAEPAPGPDPAPSAP